jgi:hypothetical protein
MSQRLRLFAPRAPKLGAVACAAALALAVAGCSKGVDKKIDASSADAYQSSVADLEKDLQAPQRAELADALREVQWSAADPQGEQRSGAAGSGPRWMDDATFRSRALQAVDGKSGRDILAQARQLALARERAQTARVSEEIAVLEAQRQAREKAAAALAAIQVESAAWSWDESLGYGRPVLRAKIRNGGEQPLTAVALEAKPAQGGPAAAAGAWTVELSPPLERGQERETSVAPDPFSAVDPWAAPALAQAGGSVELAARAQNAFGLGGVKVAPDFTAEQQARLDALKTESQRLRALDEKLAKTPENQ